MDRTTAHLAEYATGLRYEHLTTDAVRATETLLLDSIGCAIGGYHSEPARIARRIAARASSTPPATVWGSGASSSVEAAAFANGVMVRYLDFNDTYMSLEVAHPSDFIPAILAVAEAHHKSGRDALLAIVAAVEVFASFADSCNLFNKGYDHGFYISLGATAGLGNLLGLDRERMANAIALTCAANVPIRQTRSGALTMWKGCAAPHAARASVTATELAREGMTGPSAIFEGRHGVRDQVTGPFELAPFGGNGAPYAVERTGIKFFPTEYNSLLPLELILKLREHVKADDVESIHVETYHFTYTEIGSEPEKWRPTTRETADHSLPYMLAVALSDGDISVASFSEERIRDPKLPPLMDRIRISENEEFTRKCPESMECRIEVVDTRGRRFVEAGSHPKGHAKNPMSEAEVETKFRKLCAGLVTDARRDAIEEAVWSLGDARDIGDVLNLIRLDIQGEPA
ncbi:MAG TPA: MmgE/PrpD family protein [Burkholderiales bacterium]|nr:MmgE/PrpD family protein [Burkholderiales bacterium]